ncbi:MAG: PEP-CTERM sorting domain-containing protein [Verrucomicrobiales bacterium]
MSTRYLLPLIIGVSSIPTAPAAILSLDFGHVDTGTPSPLQSGFQAMSNQSQAFSTTAVSSGSISVSFTQQGTRDRGTPNADNGAFTYDELHRDLFTGLAETASDGTGNTTFSLSGLDANTDYVIQIWSYDSGFNPGAEYDWFDLSNGTPVLIGEITNSNSAPTSNEQYSFTATVTSNASGELLFGQHDPDGTGSINALILSAVPEPGTFALSLCGLLAFARRRR